MVTDRVSELQATIPVPVMRNAWAPGNPVTCPAWGYAGSALLALANHPAGGATQWERGASYIGQIPLVGNKCMGKKLKRVLDNLATEQTIMG